MAYEFEKLSEVAVVSSISDTGYVFVEDGNDVKRISKDAIAPSKTTIYADSDKNLFYDAELTNAVPSSATKELFAKGMIIIQDGVEYNPNYVDNNGAVSFGASEGDSSTVIYYMNGTMPYGNSLIQLYTDESCSNLLSYKDAVANSTKNILIKSKFSSFPSEFYIKPTYCYIQTSSGSTPTVYLFECAIRESVTSGTLTVWDFCSGAAS